MQSRLEAWANKLLSCKRLINMSVSQSAAAAAAAIVAAIAVTIATLEPPLSLSLKLLRMLRTNAS